MQSLLGKEWLVRSSSRTGNHSLEPLRSDTQLNCEESTITLRQNTTAAIYGSCGMCARKTTRICISALNCTCAGWAHAHSRKQRRAKKLAIREPRAYRIMSWAYMCLQPPSYLANCKFGHTPLVSRGLITESVIAHAHELRPLGSFFNSRHNNYNTCLSVPVTLILPSLTSYSFQTQKWPSCSLCCTF